MENVSKTGRIGILFAAFEAEPFSKTGGLGDVAGSLPQYIKTAKYDIRVVLPKLNIIPDVYVSKMRYITEFKVRLSWRDQGCGLWELKRNGITYYFLDNEYYFSRGRVYGEFDDGERVAFFSKAALEFLQYVDFEPQILHCNDWHTALMPVFLREFYNDHPKYRDIKTVFTIHNLKFQGKYSGMLLGDVLGLMNTSAAHQIMQGEAVNFLQGAVIYSDRVTTVSPTYAGEICSPYYGEGLSWLFARRRDVLSGILNGIDNKRYDPETDLQIPVHFTADTLNKKAEAKLLLQKEFGLPQDPDIPLFAVISRLTEQKGLDLITYNLPKFAGRRMQLAILGVGEPNFEEAFSWYAGKCPDHVAARIMFDEGMSRRMYAASDVMLVPSRFEPCGLTQMIAMRYGTLPLVRETGGLKDSVQPYNKFTGEGNGFSFSNYNAHEFWRTVESALDVWENNHDNWVKMQKTAMATDFGWHNSAVKYRRLYDELLRG